MYYNVLIYLDINSTMHCLNDRLTISQSKFVSYVLVISRINTINLVMSVIDTINLVMPVIETINLVMPVIDTINLVMPVIFAGYSS
jgi:hypothetical protein